MMMMQLLMLSKTSICVRPTTFQQLRFLNLHEYQSKKLLAENGVNVQRFRVVDSPKQASQAGQELMSTIAKELVIKAQILAGGRGKGTFLESGMKGGVKLTKDVSVVEGMTAKMLNNMLVTKQTGKEGVLVKKLMIAEALDIARETYLAILLDRSVGGPVIVASPCGGVDIEEVAEKQPDAIIKHVVDVSVGLTDKGVSDVIRKLEFKNEQFNVASEQLKRLYEIFNKYDCTMLEINPFGETPDGRVVCFDAKLVFDDSASFRHKELFSDEDTSEQDKRELKANQLGLNFVALGGDGNIGCMVNGAGLAMATMDLIKLHGGEPANFLDLGGTVSADQVGEALDLLKSDEKVKAILVNIFGGIVNCETIASGIIKAYSKGSIERPTVVRLQGTNVDSAKKMLEQSKLNIIPATDLADAADKAVKACAV